MAPDPYTLQSLRGTRAFSTGVSRVVRGFTLVEMMAVVAIIATISALAAPSVIRQARARRAQRDALEVLSLIQEARSRALGRGGATRIVWNGTELSISERMIDVDPGGAGGSGPTPDMPAASCAEPGGQWMPSRRWFRPRADDGNTLTVRDCNATDCTGATVGYLEVCFAPRGQTRFRLANNAAWLPLTQVYGFQIGSTEGAATVGNRFVFLSPNGLARLRL